MPNKDFALSPDNKKDERTLNPDAASGPGLSSADSPASIGLGKGRNHIALVEDDPISARILRGILERDGFQVAWFDCGESFLEALESEPFDLILLDVGLPGIEGLDVCRRIKASPGHAEIPVIFISARSDAEDVVAGFEAGGADYIPKPFQTSETLARVRTHLRMRELLIEQAGNIARLDAAVKARNRILGVTAHDLRNPLISIRGFGEMLRDGMVGKLNEDQQEMVSSVASAAAGMLTLIDDLLDLAAVDAGELNLNVEEHDLGDLMEKTIYLYRGLADRKKISLETHQPPVPVTARFDLNRMRQVVENLISNAIKFSPPGLVVSLEWGADGDGIFFAVRDQGPGIPEAERHRLFQEYGKTSVCPTAGEKSSGLGLAICRKIVEAHGGIIEATNLTGRGCEFKVVLPGHKKTPTEK